jgi:predicted nuclease of restriction endonuclease-like (RecB) superfamily
VRLLNKVRDPAEREWYVRATMEHDWSRNVLLYHIESGLYSRQGQAQTNFQRTLPAPQSDLAQELIKDPYNFEFLGLPEETKERDLHRALLTHLREFLGELGVGFAFVGSEYHLSVAGEDFYIDLLFYHLTLRAFVVIELKMTDFKPEYTGKVNFYLSAVDDQLRHADDRPSIGIILCRAKNRVIVEYSLRDVSKPIGVSQHQLAQALPDNLKGQLPTVEQFEAELSEEEER